MPRRKRSKKWLYWLLFLILVITAGVICYLVWNNYFKDKKTSGNEASSSSVVKKEEKQEEGKGGEEKKDTEEPVVKERVVQYEGEDPNTLNELTGALTYAGVSGNYLMIRVNIDQYLNEGTCTLGIRKDGGNVYSEIARIIDSASTATCEGFNIPLAELPDGKVNISIYLSASGKTGEIHGEVEI